MRGSDCRCTRQKVEATHAYLQRFFPEHTLSDFHAPIRLLQAGLPPPHSGHHVVRLTEGLTDLYLIMTYDLQQCPAAYIAALLQELQVAQLLKVEPIVVLYRDDARPLEIDSGTPDASSAAA